MLQRTTLLITLIEKWKKSVDNCRAFDPLLTDPSKAFNCLPHELLIVKLDEKMVLTKVTEGA